MLFRSYHHKPQSVNAGYFPTLYVDPDTRLVCVSKPHKRPNYAKEQQEKRNQMVRILGDYHQLLKINGIWYEVKGTPKELMNTFSMWLHRYRRCGPRDILIGEDHAWWRRGSERPYVEIILKRQLSSKELKKHNLQND